MRFSNTISYNTNIETMRFLNTISYNTNTETSTIPGTPSSVRPVPVPLDDEGPARQAHPDGSQQGEAVRLPDLHGQIRTEGAPPG
jgi:hypothetical protein